MANGSFTIAKGSEVAYHTNVNDNSPTNSALILVVLSTTGLVSDATLSAYDTLAAVLAVNDEADNTGYARITITDTGVVAPVVDDTAGTVTLTLADQTTAAITAGDSWAKLLICYDSDTTGGTDANIIPVKYFDIRDPVTGSPIAPSGGTVTHSWPNGYHIAS